MKKTLIFTLLIGLTHNARPATEIELLSHDTHHLQKVANLLRIYTTTRPDESLQIIKDARESDDIDHAKHDALKILQKALGPFLDKTITTTYLAYTKEQRYRINKCYEQLLSKLKNKTRRILYGSKAGSELPSSLDLKTY